MSAGFSISSPDIEALQRQFEQADPILAYTRAASGFGSDVVEPAMAQRFAASDRLSDDTLDALGTYIHPSGRAYTGIPANSRHNASVREVEYGSPGWAPERPIRSTLAEHRESFSAQAAEYLNRELAAEIAGEVEE